MTKCIKRLDSAIERRGELINDPATTAWRIFNGAADGIDGLVIEKFGDVLFVQLHEGWLRVSETEARSLCAYAKRRLGARAVYRKLFPTNRSAAERMLGTLHTDPTPWLGSPAEAEFGILEHGLRFLIRPYDGYAVGLFLEQRDNRQRVHRLAAGRRVLNAFAYTCAFSVAAAMGGAAATTSVDVSKKHLEWGKRNFAANGLELSAHRFISSDIFDFYNRARRQRRRYDLIILDPPTFGRSKRPKRSFVLTEDLQRLVSDAVSLLAAGGYVLLATNHRGTSWARLRQVLANAAGGRSFEIVERPSLPTDFRDDKGYAKFIVGRFD